MDGKLQERSKSINESTVMIIMSFFVLTAGIIIGSVYLMHVASDSDAMLGNYLNSFFVTGANGINKSAAFKNALRENAVYFLIIFIAGFFRIGILFVALALLRKGFILGFTSAALMKFYGIKGAVTAAAMLPGIIFIVPAFLFFATASADLSLRKEKNTKKIIFSYIFFSLIIMTIFCAASLSDGYLTTIFIKNISPKIIH